MNRIVDHIEATIRRREGTHTAATATTHAGEVTIRCNLDRDGVKASFPKKPDKEIRLIEEMLAKVSEHEPVTQVEVVISPGLQDRHEQRAIRECEKSRRNPSVLMTLYASAPSATGMKMAHRGWW